jgi:ribonuclease HI
MSQSPAPPRPRRLKIFFDGGCRPNPGPIEAAVVVRGVIHFFDDLGSGTSHDAEWLALRAALRIAQSLGAAEFELIGDCANVIAQANGLARCRTEAAAAHYAGFHASAAAGAPRRIRWIARTQNLAGIALSRRRAGVIRP